MSGVRRRGQHGFTLIEFLTVIVIAGTGIAAALELFGTSDRLAADTSLRLRASARYRNAHKAIAQELRNVDITTLAGFDMSGVATQPRFKPVTGMAGGTITHGVECELRFEERDPNLPGIGSVGEIVLRRAGLPPEILVRQVVASTFQMRQEGRNLVVRLRIYEGSNPENLTTIQGETVVSLRN